MITYLIKSHGLHKIGKTKNWDKRQKLYNTHNPKWKLIHLIDTDVEADLHLLYATKRVTGEWFNLDKTDVSTIKQLTADTIQNLRCDEMQLLLNSTKIIPAGILVSDLLEMTKISNLNWLRLKSRFLEITGYYIIEDSNRELIVFKDCTLLFNFA